MEKQRNFFAAIDSSSRTIQLLNGNPEGIHPLHRARMKLGCLLAALVAVFLASASSSNGALVFQTIYEFRSNPRNPQAGLVLAGDGNFYGTTSQGGTNGNYGTVYRITPGGVLNVIHSFKSLDGEIPVAPLILGKDDQLYGTAQGGGTNGDYGTIFRITTNGVFSLLYSFNGPDGRYPQAALAQGGDGNFYGTTAFGGTDGDNGTVFKITPEGDLTSLFSFGGLNGSRPIAYVSPLNDGTILGTTLEGGPDWDGVDLFGDGTIFQIAADGTFTTLFAFGDIDGSFPAAGLVLGADGNFYGTTEFGGANDDGYGTVFQMAADGTVTSLYAFEGQDSKYPQAPLVQIEDGSLLGTAPLGVTTKGAVFQITTNGEFATIHTFDGTNGARPLSALVRGSDGAYYGTTFEGGAANNGTIFRLIDRPVAPIISGISAANGIVTLSWESVPQKSYRVEYNANLATTNWSGLIPDIVATSAKTFFTNNVAGAAQRYYRIELLP